MSAFIDLQAFIPRVSPRRVSPRHLTPLTDVFTRIASGESVKVVVDVPPRFGKTETIKHGVAWLEVQDPSRQVCYATHSDRIARKKSRELRELAKRAGVPIASDSKSRSDWRTTVEEGGCWATSLGGSVTGEGFDLVVVDDPQKGRAAAESSLIRDRNHEWLIADIMTRLEPGGSIIVNGTRWHPDDLQGRLIASGWEHVSLPAITPAGESLWPERWPLDLLLAKQHELGGPDGYEWCSLYMGQPRGRGARVFGDVHFYDALPDLDWASLSCGLDFAYSVRTSADWSVAVVLAALDGLYYVLDVVRVQDEPRSFRSRVQLLHETYPSMVASAYAAATELGGIEFIREAGIPINGHTAKVDKFSRAIGTAAAWNTGKILLPRKATWLNAFVSEVCGFTGVKDRHDDQVDALAAAFDELHFNDQDLSVGGTTGRGWNPPNVARHWR